MRAACKPNATSWQASSALRYELTQPATSVASVARDVATFLLVRGPFAWIGHGWVGCAAPAHAPANETQYVRPAALDADYGDPVDATCAETAPGSGVFAREWSKASVSVDCNTLEGLIQDALLLAATHNEEFDGTCDVTDLTAAQAWLKTARAALSHAAVAAPESAPSTAKVSLIPPAASHGL